MQTEIEYIKKKVSELEDEINISKKLNKQFVIEISLLPKRGDGEYDEYLIEYRINMPIQDVIERVGKVLDELKKM